MDLTINAATIAFFGGIGGVLAAVIGILFRELLKSKDQQIDALRGENRDLRDVAYKSLNEDADRFKRLEVIMGHLSDEMVAARRRGA